MTRLALLVAVAGCASAPPERAVRTAAAARLEIVNLTSRSWDVTFTTADGQTRTAHILPEGRVAVDAAAGASALEQTLLDPQSNPVATRKIAIQLNAGETYTFPLATLAGLGDPAHVDAR